MFAVPPIVFLVAVPVVVLAIVAFAAWDIRRTWRTIDRETEAARARGFFDGELEEQMRRDSRMVPGLGSRTRWPR